MKIQFCATIVATLLLSSTAMATGKHEPPKPTPTPPGSTSSANSSSAAAAIAAQQQSQTQAQSQSVKTGAVKTNVRNNVRTNVNNTARGGKGGAGGTGYGGNGYASANNAGNTQVVNTPRDRLQAPGLAASFSSVSGNPCEGAPFGAGITAPGLGALFQIPRASKRCDDRMDAMLLHSWGYSGAAVAVLAGNGVGVAVSNNPLPVYRPMMRASVKRSVRRAKPCGC